MNEESQLAKYREAAIRADEQIATLWKLVNTLRETVSLYKAIKASDERIIEGQQTVLKTQQSIISELETAIKQVA